MNGGAKASRKFCDGFTIVETMIFITVSTIIFIGAMNLMGGKQGKTEFQTGLGLFISQLNSQINDVNTGNYVLPPNTSCQIQPGYVAPELYPGVNNPSPDCTFIGEIMVFDTNATANGSVNDQYTVYPVLGRHYAFGTTNEVTNLNDAYPRIYESLSNASTVPYGLSVASISYSNGSMTGKTGAIGFFTTFNTYTVSNLNSGSQHILLVPLPNDSLTANQGQPDPVLQQIDGSGLTDSATACGGTSSQTFVCYRPGAQTYGATPENPAQGVTICVNSGSTNQSAKLTLYSTTSTISDQIYNGAGCV